VWISSFLWLLAEKRAGNRPNSHIQAVLDETGQFAAMLRYDLGKEPGIAYLWYIAVHPDARGGGIGSACFNEVVRRAQEAGLRGVIFEVEVPEHFDDPERRRNACRRIEFYRRQGALVLTGIRYIQQLRNQPPIPLHIMVRPIENITPGEALEIAQRLFDDVTQVGELELS
jgi:ribosomal protein S18 acetylase RimI-like enzyme